MMYSSVDGMLLTGENRRTGEDTCVSVSVSVTLSQVKEFPTDLIKTNETHALVFSALYSVRYIQCIMFQIY
jgi:hypothetical protein